ncbi:MAG: ANTAR domain-containing protein [Bryobacteraceae bacterium]
MSALAQRPDSQFQIRRLSELEVSREVSREASRATQPDEALHAFAALVLRIKGVRAMKIEDAPAVEPLVAGPLAWRDSARSTPRGAVVADIAAAGRRWGTLRLQFDLEQIKMEDPLAFARFLGQQTGILLNRFDLEREHGRILEKVTRFQTRLATRKVFERAKGVLSHKRGITQQHAARLLLSYRRNSGCSMRVVAEAVIYDAAQTKRFASPPERDRYGRTRKTA